MVDSILVQVLWRVRLSIQGETLHSISSMDSHSINDEAFSQQYEVEVHIRILSIVSIPIS